MNIVEEINKLDPQNPGIWPWPFQAAVMLIVFIAILFAGWKFDISQQREELASVERKEQELRDTLETKQKKAANLNALKEQMKEMEQSFGDMLRQLPNKTEIAGLIIDISQTGLAAGLEFDLFRPKQEQPTEFYAELPIDIVVKGGYHEIGEFVSGLAELPRIVTTHEIKLTKQGQGDTLQMSAVAKTYRALDEDES
ncbi:MAG: type 4a pilus biogenesis protein PilO [Gammaproteobacteria bacterium]